MRAQKQKYALAAFCAAFLFSSGCRNFNNFWGDKNASNGQTGVTTNPNQVVSPVFSPVSGSYNATQNVAITSTTSGAVICYTTDGVTVPVFNNSTGLCTTGTTYSALISVPTTQTLMAIAGKVGMQDSLVSSAPYTIDSTAPTISLTAPAAGTYVTNTQVTYTTNEACNVGTVTWTRTAGTADPGSPRVQSLVGAELTAGTHTAVTLTNNPALVDGTTYTLTFNCTDAAGNAATAATITGVTYDFAVPVISAITPANGAFQSTTKVSYTLSETCNTGNVTWTRTGGTADAGSPRIQALVGAELTAGAHNNITLTNNPALVSGTIYTVSFNCTDFAAQAATTVSSTSVTFDNVVPSIAGFTPANNSYVNSTTLSYTFSETCATATITWAQTGGTADGGSPHVQTLTGGELTSGAHSGITITNNPTLVSGAIYTMTINCSDAAGNAATAVSNTNITYDNVNVVISAVSPASSVYVNNTQVSYTLSEACASGTITWTRTGGAADGSAHAQALTGAELNAGVHTGITLTNNPVLVDGSIYTVQFDCVDFAANAATPIVVTNVTYDITVPVISAVTPAASSYVNNQQVSYTLSETCSTGGINWTYTGGAASGSFNQGLIAGELTAGAHGPFTISNNPALVSGATYTMTFSCTDLAGNVATPITRTGVTFDNTPPTISITNLMNNGPLNTNKVLGTANDNVAGALTVQVSLDGGANNAAAGYPSWNFILPTGASTWLYGTTHTIAAKVTDLAGNSSTIFTVTVRKGNNQDLNGDGFPDIAFGAWAAAPTSTGKAYVFYGSASGITATLATSAATIITGAATSNYCGRQMAIADFNGDGYGDLAVSAYGNTSNNGKVYIYSGSVSGIAAGSITVPTGASVTLTGVSAEQLGSGLVAGNANNDPYADLLVGAVANATQKGAFYVYMGGAGGLSASASVTGTGENASDRFSTGLALGDFNADGNPDIAVGAEGYATSKGRAYIYYGSAGIVTGGAATIAKSIQSPTNPSGFYGGTMTAGDLNGDGVTDLAVGAYGDGSNQGLVRIYYGIAGAGIPINDTASPNTSFAGEAANHYFTTNMAIVDTNADGYGDLIIGAHGSTVMPGKSYLFMGQATMLTSGVATLANTIFTGDAGGMYQFGRAVNAADVNGDGRPDIFVGANYFGNPTYNGRAYGFLNPLGVSPINATTSSTNIGGSSAEEFGVSISK